MKYLALFLVFLTLLIPAPIHAITNTGSAPFASANNQYASKTTGASYPTGSSARSITYWVKTSDTSSQSTVELGTATNLGLMEFFINVFAASDNIGLALNNGNVHYTATNITDGNWKFMVFTYSGGAIATNGKMYMNATQLTQAGANNQTPNTGTGCIGIASQTCNSPGSSDLNGSLDDVRIYNRVLTSTEITNMYNDPCNSSPVDGLISYYPLDTDFNDATTTANNLSAVGSPVPTTSSADQAFTCSTPESTKYPFIDVVRNVTIKDNVVLKVNN